MEGEVDKIKSSKEVEISLLGNSAVVDCRFLMELFKNFD